MELIIIGSIGSARNVLEQIIEANTKHKSLIRVTGIIIDSEAPGTLIQGVPVLGGKEKIKELIQSSNAKFIFCLYRPDKMKERAELLLGLNIPDNRYANFIHPSAYIAPSVKLGVGNVIMSHTTIQSNVSIGNNNIFNSNITIEHESDIGNFNFFAANSVIGSKTKINNYNFIGLNSSVRENVELENVFIGMHSMVLHNFSNVSIIGIPAKPYLWNDNS